MKKLSAIVALVFAVNFFTPVSPAHAANRCESVETTLVAAIQVATNISDITNAANQFRSCLSNYADAGRVDSLNGDMQVINILGGDFYRIFTAANTYNMSRNISSFDSRGIALRAAADYRMLLIGEESEVNPAIGNSDCETPYTRLLAGANVIGDASLAATAVQAIRQCPLIRANPRSTISITNSAVSVGQTLTGVTLNWPAGAKAFQWLKDGNAISGETSERYLIKASDVGSRLSLRVTISYPGKISATKTSNLSQTITLSTAVPSPTPTASVPQPTFPIITGTFQAGTELRTSFVITAWTLKALEWLVDGQVHEPNRNHNQIFLSEQMVGRHLSVRFTWSRPGVADVILTSSGGVVQPSLKLPASPSPSPSTKATLDIVPLLVVLGKSLVLKTSSPNPATDSALSLQKIWYRDGKVLPGVSGSKYTPRSSDFGHKYSVEIVSTSAGSKTESRKSNEQTWGVQGNTSLIGGINSCRPKLAGALKVGSTVKVQVCVSFSGISIAYVWYRDSKEITNWPDGKYRKITAQDRGHTLSFVAEYYGKGKDQYLEIASKDYFVK